MSDKNHNGNSDNNDKQGPKSEPLIKGDVPDFEYTPPPPTPETDKDSE